MWWQEQNDNMRAKAISLAKSGRLEFVTGGWTMTDEASPHLNEIIHSMTEGNIWLMDNLGVKPRVGWAIDPFGHSSSIPYLASLLQLDAIVINRVHKETKEEFRRDKNLEFVWRQNWEINSDSHKYDMFTHMLAYPLYDIPNTCGPDWDICAEFDFERPQAKQISASNIQERAKTLLNQYRSKAVHFRHNNVLIPLGDDFKYKTLDMTLDMFTNYQKLFDYINENSHTFDVDIKFATLSEYFDAVHSSTQSDDSLSFPVYNGDFFTYSDRENEYWSGYFTTRPYVKSLSRQTESIIKSTESLYALSKIYFNNIKRYDWQKGYNYLNEARKSLSLYQHHDGITGTSKAYVSKDYANQLHNSLWQLKDLTKELLELSESESIQLSIADSKGSDSFKLSSPTVINLSKNFKKIVIYNPLIRQRTQLIKIIVNSHQVELVDSQYKSIEYSAVPAINKNSLSTDSFEVYFIVDVSPLSVINYYIKISDSSEVASSTYIYSSALKSTSSSFKVYSDSREFPGGITSIENENIKVELQSNGLISGLYSIKDSIKVDMKQEMLTYSTRRSGAYIFVPDSQATILPSQSSNFVIIKSKHVSRSIVDYGNNIVAIISVYPSSCFDSYVNDIPMVELVFSLNLGESYFYNNKELICRFTSSDIKNKDIFYTDSNSIDMQLRKVDNSRPISSNYYPITTAAMFADQQSKLSLLTSQPLGFGSLNEGQFEFMLDRRLNQDDGRGMGEGVQDNVFTISKFYLTLQNSKDHLPYILYPQDHQLWEYLNYPMLFHYQSDDNSNNKRVSSGIQPFEFITVPSEIEIQTFRSLFYETDDNTLLVRIRSLSTSTIIDLNLLSLFEHFEIQSVIETSLTTLYNKSSGHSILHFTSDEANKISHIRGNIIQYPTINNDNKVSYLNKNYEMSLYPMEIKTLLLNIKPGSNKIKPQENGEPEETSIQKNKYQQEDKKEEEEERMQTKTETYNTPEVKKVDKEAEEEVISAWSLYMPTMLFFMLGGVIVIFGRKRNRRKLGRIVKELLSKIRPKKTARLVV